MTIDEDNVPDEVAIDRELGLRGTLLDFTEMAWPIVEPGSEFHNTWHLGLVSEHLEAVYRRQIRRLVINIPPGCSKSLMACVFWPTWCWIKEPGLRWLFASFDPDLTLRDARRSLKIIKDPWFQKRWGDRIVTSKDPPAGFIENTAAGFRFATSVKGKATGRHADFHVIDDPIKPQNLTKIALKEASEWRKGTLASRFHDSKGCQVLIMQRLHEADLAAECIEEGWTHLCLPMRFEQEHRCVTSYGKDPRTEEGELLCPARFDEPAVKLLEKDMTPIVAAAQLQQRPVPLGGAIFKREWFKYWRVLPPKWDQLISSWDCAFKGTDKSDFVVGQIWGRRGPDYFLVDQVRNRMDFPSTLIAFRSLAEKHPRALAKLVEDKANGPAVIQTLEKEISGIVEVDPEGGKEARGNAVSPLFQAGNVYLPDPSMPGFEWVAKVYESELLSFPMGRNDDQVDATSQALLFLHQHVNRLREAMAKVRERGGLL